VNSKQAATGICQLASSRSKFLQFKYTLVLFIKTGENAEIINAFSPVIIHRGSVNRFLFSDILCHFFLHENIQDHKNKWNKIE